VSIDFLQMIDDSEVNGIVVDLTSSRSSLGKESFVLRGAKQWDKRVAEAGLIPFLKFQAESWDVGAANMWRVNAAFPKTPQLLSIGSSNVPRIERIERTA
jgi:hypothetical protein